MGQPAEHRAAGNGSCARRCSPRRRNFKIQRLMWACLVVVTLKNELIYRRTWPTRAAAQRAIFEFIEVFYNRQRLHSSLGYLSPAEYEAGKVHQPRTAQAA